MAAFIAGSSRAADVVLAWDADSDPTVTGYRLHVGTYSGVYPQTLDVGNATASSVSNLLSGTTYYFIVTAYNSASVESAPSNEVSYTTAGATPTPTPGSSPTPSPSVTPQPTPTPSSTPTSTPRPTLSLRPSTLSNGTMGRSYSKNITASGGSSPYSFTITSGSLPPGLVLSSGGGLSGTPTSPGAFSFTIQATDRNGATGTASYGFTVATPKISLSPSRLSKGTVGHSYSTNITASGGSSPYSFTITSGSLPPGLMLASDGGLSGIPTSSGTFQFAIQATDGNGYTGTKSYSLLISSGSGTRPTPTPTPTPTATPAPTATPSPSPTPTPTPSPTPDPSATPTPTATPSPSPTLTPTPSPTPDPSATPTPTPSPTPDPSATPTPTPSPTPDPNATPTPTPSPTPDPSATPTPTPDPTATPPGG